MEEREVERMMVLPREYTDALREIIADFISSHLKLVRDEYLQPDFFSPSAL